MSSRKTTTKGAAKKARRAGAANLTTSTAPTLTAYDVARLAHALDFHPDLSEQDARQLGDAITDLDLTPRALNEIGINALTMSFRLMRATTTKPVRHSKVTPKNVGAQMDLTAFASLRELVTKHARLIKETPAELRFKAYADVLRALIESEDTPEVLRETLAETMRALASVLIHNAQQLNGFKGRPTLAATLKGLAQTLANAETRGIRPVFGCSMFDHESKRHLTGDDNNPRLDKYAGKGGDK